MRRPLARLAGALVLAVVAGACTPAELDQPQAGDGWRLVAWTRGGEQVAPQIGDDALRVAGDWGLLRAAGRQAASVAAGEIDLVVVHNVSGSCPQVRFDGLAIDHAEAVVEARFTDIEDLFYVGGCSADANPVAFWVAVSRDGLPDGEFTIRSEKAPDVVTIVDRLAPPS